ncbi:MULTISPECIES: type IX secretion system ring subunit PorN/GldN [Flavobacterium]|uniref:Protein involved in gliding motility GldN n=2 Tax=Flavobacterium TaxID=237 RepID=A0A562KBJ5_9FLAO|nr:MULTISPECIES: gliding motility protein GldN [Flavobacterium]TDR24021.1 protein involved in gliding motility GldN [Flavobacterium cheniae]TWH92585.1 protein involved in gliding motility GldN [Flavobacterium cheniae]
MNWRNSIAILVLGLSATTFAQSNLLNAKTPDQIGKKTEAELSADNDKPLPYGYVHDRDILMGKRIWEFVDLDERVNFPLYFPVEGDVMSSPDRRPLYNVLINGIKEGKITEVYDSSYFTTKKTLKDIESSLYTVDTTDVGREQMNEDMEAYRKGTKKIDEEFIRKTEIEAYDVSAYRIVGYWYFDKRQGELKYRLLGICPVVPDVFSKKNNDAELEYIDLFWVYFPSTRDILHEAKAFNNRNSAMPFSFDHLLNARRFNGMIYLEENVYGDRKIADYMKENSQMQLLESDRVKEKIRDFEQDMWNY